jgi:hypothetical protein
MWNHGVRNKANVFIVFHCSPVTLYVTRTNQKGWEGNAGERRREDKRKTEIKEMKGVCEG